MMTGLSERGGGQAIPVYSVPNSNITLVRWEREDNAEFPLTVVSFYVPAYHPLGAGPVEISFANQARAACARRACVCVCVGARECLSVRLCIRERGREGEGDRARERDR